LKQSIDDITELTIINISDVSGVTEGSENYVTITLKGTMSNKPIVNFIALQTESQKATALCAGKTISTILGENETLEDVLLEEVELITTKGIQKSSDITFNGVEYVETANGAMLQVEYVENKSGIIYTQYIIIPDEKGGIYYYVDLGQLDPVKGALEAYNNIALIHSKTLINKDAMDKYATNETDWGRLGDSSIWSDYYQTDTDTMSSCAEVKTSEVVGGTKRKTIEIRMPGLKAGNYIVEVGVNMHGWGSSRRAVTFAMGETKIGYKADYGDINVWEFEYNKTDDETVVFQAYTEGDNPANVLLGYIIVRENIALSEEQIKTPVITTSLSLDVTEIEVKELTEGSLLYLVDDTSKVIANARIGFEEAQGGYVFTNLDLTNSQSVGLVVTKNGKIVKSSQINLNILKNSAPRLEWSALSDTIELTIKSEAGISTLEYRYEDDSVWTNIKKERYFRATKNGNYHVRMVLMNNEVIEKVICVTHVDSCEMNILTDLNVWQKQSVLFEANIALETGLSKMTLTSGEIAIDVTEYYNGGKFAYTFTQNGEYILTCESIKGNTFDFNFTINRIDVEVPTLSFETLNEGGIFKVNLIKGETKSPVKVYVENNGKKVELFEDFYKIYKNGSYTFIIVNEAGSASKYTVNFGASINANMNLTLTKMGDKVSVVSSKAGVSKMQVYKGSTSSVIGSAGIYVSNEGVYSILVSYEDVSYYVVNFVINASKDKEGKGGCFGSMQMSSLLFVLCGMSVIVLTKKIKGGVRNEK
ncbi:MAG: hypothetical protein IKT32_03310, partial [Clostridia bacterium]|nr:hypothetical protein [Clostridia bacterium]